MSLPDWLVKNQVSGFDGQWKRDIWILLSAGKAENREAAWQGVVWQLQEL